jgi:hypothetical protein
MAFRQRRESVNRRAMKITIGNQKFHSLTSPTLHAEPVKVDGGRQLRVWCNHCRDYHFHRPVPGHREAHCKDDESPYLVSGYNLAVGGRSFLEG